MAKVHILTMTSHGHFDALVHFLMPVGSNPVGVAWKTAALAAGVIGAEAHAMADEDEKAAILAGDRVELRVVLTVDPIGMSGAQITAAVEAAAEREKALWIAAQQVALKYFGYKQGTVN